MHGETRILYSLRLIGDGATRKHRTRGVGTSVVIPAQAGIQAGQTHSVRSSTMGALRPPMPPDWPTLGADIKGDALDYLEV